MSNPDKPIKNQKGVFDFGRIVILILGLFFFSKLTKDSHLILASTSSIAFFLSFYFYQKIPNKTGQSAALPVFSIVSGAIELIVVAMLITNADFKTGFAIWVIPTNVLFGTVGFLSLYNAVVFYKKPDLFLSSYPPPPPDPIEGFPTTVKDVVNEGRMILFKVTAIPSFLLLGIGLLVFLWTFPLLHNPGLILLVYILANGIGFGIVAYLRHMAARKWREWALESGIPKETLEEAAKLGGIPWPKIKEE